MPPQAASHNVLAVIGRIRELIESEQSDEAITLAAEAIAAEDDSTPAAIELARVAAEAVQAHAVEQLDAAGI